MDWGLDKKTILTTVAGVTIPIGLYVVWRVIIYPQVTWRKLSSQIPGPKQHWLWGGVHYPKSVADTIVLDSKWAHEFGYGKGGIYKNWAMWFYPWIILCEPDTIAPILRTATPKSFIYGLLYDWLGVGLLTSGGAKWRNKRKMLTPAFHYQNLIGYCHIFHRQTEKMLNKWEEIDEKEEQEMQNWITNLTLDIIGESAFGYQINSQDSQSDYVKAINSVMTLFFNRLFNPLLFIDFIYKLTPSGYRWRRDLRVVHSLPETVIKQRIEQNKRNPPKTEEDFQDFLDIVLQAKDENGKEWTIREIRDEVDTFMFEGHDTTANGLLWTLYCIANNPDVEQRVFEEVDQILGNSSFPSDYEHLKKFTYLSCVIKEAQRLYPPVPYIGRTLTETIEINGLSFPPNTDMDIFVYGVHRSPNHWPNPDKFDPDRFTPENSKGRHPFAYIPFSAGPRNCIGQNFAFNEEITILSMIYKRFYVRLVPGHEVVPEPMVVLRPKTGMKMTIHKRT